MKKSITLLITVLMLFAVYTFVVQSPAQAEEPAPENAELIALGKALFFDADLSVNGKQSCASCHAPEVGFTGPDSQINALGAIYPGALHNRFGNRKPPTSAYAGDSPILYFDEVGEEWVGGMFWDGRATGWTLDDPLAEQAQGPFLNPLEQALPNARLLVIKVINSDYADLFRSVWGPDSLSLMNVAGAYERIAFSIAAYERSTESSAYTSKFDRFWDNAVAEGKDVTLIEWGMGGGGMGSGPGGGGGGSSNPYRWQAYRGLGLSDAELQGLAAFNDPRRADCASCHSLEPGPEGYPLFTDFRYDNVGVPRNPDNPFYGMPRQWNPDGESWIDYGLGAYLQSIGYRPDVYEPQLGKFKAPTLRNVDLRPNEDFVKAYGHNGYFKSLEEIVHFYAWRGMMDSGCSGGGPSGGGPGGGGMDCEQMSNLFPEPEVAQNVAEMKHFSMMDQQNIVTFLKTLSDGFVEE